MIGDPSSRWANTEEESSYVSITDMLIGLIFLFLIMLMYFATQLRDTTDDITNSETTRNQLIDQIADYMHQQGVAVTVDHTSGVLRFPAEVLFARSSDKPLGQGQHTLAVLADAMALKLPCYSFGAPATATADCAPTTHHVDAVFIEGHTDSTPVGAPLTHTGTGGQGVEISDNWGLSTSRAANVYRLLVADRPELDQLYSAPRGERDSRQLFGIAGYADQRPIADGTDDASRTLNRRVEVRFVMAAAKTEQKFIGTPPVDRRANPPPAPVAPGQLIDFRVNNPTDSYLTTGWSWREDWGVWSIGRDSALRIPLNPVDPAKAYDLTLQVVAYVPYASPRREVSVQVDGRELAKWTFDGPANSHTETLRIPPGLLQMGKPIDVRFITANPVSPKALGLSTDDRQIGLGVVTAKIRPAS